MTHFAKTTYAVVEVSLPFHIKMERNEKSMSIKSIGYDDIDGQLKHATSAHPVIDRKTQEFFVFTWHVMAPKYELSIFDQN